MPAGVAGEVEAVPEGFAAVTIVGRGGGANGGGGSAGGRGSGFSMSASAFR